MVYPSLLPLMRAPRLPVVDWTDSPAVFKWTRPFCRKTKSDFCACAITFQLASTRLTPVYKQRHRVPSWVSRLTVGIKADYSYILTASYCAALVSCNWIFSVLRSPYRSREWIICCHKLNDDSFTIKFLCARTNTVTWTWLRRLGPARQWQCALSGILWQNEVRRKLWIGVVRYRLCSSLGESNFACTM